MTNSTNKTTVVFRKESGGGILAIFPYDIYNWQGDMTGYSHIGQTCRVSKGYYTESTKKAYPMEYDRLLKELESQGYDLEVRQQIRWEKVKDELNRII